MARDEHRSFNRNDQNAPIGVGSNPGKRKRSTSPTYGPDSVETCGVSETEQETFAFFWTLNNFSSFSGAEEVNSPIFRGGLKSNHSWLLGIEPKKKVEEQEYLSVSLNLAEFGDEDTSENRKIKVRFQISILDADGRPGKQAGSAFMNACEFTKGQSIGWEKFLLSTDLISPSRRLVVNDSLKIHCRVWIDGGIKHKVYSGGAATKSLPEEEKVKLRMKRLANDFGKLFKDTVMADIAVTTDNSTFMAHKAVLAARSSVFAAMFNTIMVEKELNTVKISDFEDDVVKAMLEYLYTGETELLQNRAPDLLQIAEKYDLTELKEDCEDTIADNLTVENAAQILIIACTYNANMLKSRVINYIKSNKEALRTKSFVTRMSQAHPSVLVALCLSQ